MTIHGSTNETRVRKAIAQALLSGEYESIGDIALCMARELDRKEEAISLMIERIELHAPKDC